MNGDQRKFTTYCKIMKRRNVAMYNVLSTIGARSSCQVFLRIMFLFVMFRITPPPTSTSTSPPRARCRMKLARCVLKQAPNRSKGRDNQVSYLHCRGNIVPQSLAAGCNLHHIIPDQQKDFTMYHGFTRNSAFQMSISWHEVELK